MPKDTPPDQTPPQDEETAAAEVSPEISEDELLDELVADEVDGDLVADLEGAEPADGEDLTDDEDGPAARSGSAALAPRRATLPSPRRGSADSLHLYMQEIGRFAVLKPEEELELARRVVSSGDQDAAFRLVTSHLRLVVKIAMDFQRRWMQNVLDLIQEGNVGLMRAVQKFDPEKGIKFSYYAAFWIKAYILKFIMDNWRMVKIGTTQTQRKLFYNLNKERQRLQALGFDPTTAALSERLGVPVADIEEMEQRLSKGDMSLDITMGDDSTATRLDFLPALGPGVEETLADTEIARLLQKHLDGIRPLLTDKELVILEKRLLTDSPVTLREIGEQYGITRERVRQIEARLLQKLREHLADKIEDFSPTWIHDDG